MENDLIDRNALLKKWDEKFFAMGADRLGCNGDEIMWYLNSLLDEIKNAPTVDNVSVSKHELECMRLIDADKLRPDCLTKGGSFAISQSQIANAPTVEQPQGEWINTRIDEWKIYATCNSCGKEMRFPEFNNYCPNCGAKMKID